MQDNYLYYMCFNHKMQVAHIKKYMLDNGYYVQHPTVIHGIKEIQKKMIDDYDYVRVINELNDLGNLGVTFDTWVTATPAISATTPPVFTAGAQGYVDTDVTLDQWTINDVRDLKNYVDDVIVP